MTSKSKDRDKSRAMLIAPCGMNCGLCHAFLRSRNPCPGCRSDDRGKPKTRVACLIKNCESRIRTGTDFCGDCASFPCGSLVRLDKRYRANYGMSMIDNLQAIKSSGMGGFLREEQARWECSRCGETICVHKAHCLGCQRRWR